MRKVVYIMSDVRSGSTLLEYLLANSNELLSVGELNHLDSHINRGKLGKTWDWNCSCGQSIKSCSFWSKVIEECDKNGVLYNHTSIIFEGKSGVSKAINEIVIKQIQGIYHAIFSLESIKGIVDSSKKPWQGLKVYQETPYDVKIIYLKRDIRAVALSKMKWTKKFEGIKLNSFRTLVGTKIYDIRVKRTIRQIAKKDWYRISYKELATNPQETINKLMDFLELERYIVPKYMEFKDSHTIGGTPSRFEKRKIVYDNGWKKVSRIKPFFHIMGKLIDAF